MAAAPREIAIRLEDARQLVDLLAKAAKTVKSDTAKKILLRAACDMADLAIDQQKLSKAA
jgi:hypothetical protein